MSVLLVLAKSWQSFSSEDFRLLVRIVESFMLVFGGQPETFFNTGLLKTVVFNHGVVFVY